MTNWMDPETFWLNVVNLLLGLVTLAALLLVVTAAGQDLLARWRAVRTPAMEREEPQRLRLPSLGLTMADGGEKVDDTETTKDETQ